MKLVMFAVLALAAVGLAVALVIGARFDLVGAVLIALSALVLAAFVLSRFKGILNLELDRRLPRAFLTSDRR